MTLLQELADDVGVHERTLRRGLSEGLLRGRRPTPRSVELDPGEIAYLRAHWSLLAALRETLRTERDVRLAVLIGSAARGELEDGSDVDLLVDLDDMGWRAQDRLRERLARAAGRTVDLVTLRAALADAPLLYDALREGRVLVDRNRQWPTLRARGQVIAWEADRAAGERRRELHALMSELSHDA